MEEQDPQKTQQLQRRKAETRRARRRYYEKQGRDVPDEPQKRGRKKNYIEREKRFYDDTTSQKLYFEDEIRTAKIKIELVEKEYSDHIDNLCTYLKLNEHKDIFKKYYPFDEIDVSKVDKSELNSLYDILYALNDLKKAQEIKSSSPFG